MWKRTLLLHLDDRLLAQARADHCDELANGRHDEIGGDSQRAVTGHYLIANRLLGGWAVASWLNKATSQPAMCSWQTQAKPKTTATSLTGAIVIPAPMLRGSGDRVYP